MGVSTTHRINLSMWILIYSFSDTYYVWAACVLTLISFIGKRRSSRITHTEKKKEAFGEIWYNSQLVFNSTLQWHISVKKINHLECTWLTCTLYHCHSKHSLSLILRTTEYNNIIQGCYHHDGKLNFVQNARMWPWQLTVLNQTFNKNFLSWPS